MFSQALRAALLDTSVFDEIGEEPESMFRSMGVVFIVAIAFGLGIWSLFRSNATDAQQSELLMMLLVAISTVVMGWSIWAGFVWLLGNKLFGGHAGYREGLRALGISYAPIALWLLVNVPVLGGPMALAGHVWLLAVGVAAIHHVQEFAWWKAVIAGVVGWFWALLFLPFLFIVPPE